MRTVNPKFGKLVPTPPGFVDIIRVHGHDYRIKYVTTISYPKFALDGFNDPNKHTIWIATRGRTPAHMADILWHELTHVCHAYWGPSIKRQEGLPSFTKDELESLVLLEEAFMPTLLRANPWFHALFGK